MTGRTLPRGDEGVTLVELLVALVFTAGVLLALTLGSVSAFASVKTSSAQAAADQVVDDTVESLRAATWSTIAPATYGTVATLTPTTATRDGSSFALTGTVQWVDETCNNGSNPVPDVNKRDFLQLDVVATWRTKGVVRTRSATTFRSPTLLEQTPVRTSASC